MQNTQQTSIKVLVTEYLASNKRIGWSTRELTKRAAKYLVKAVGNIQVGLFGSQEAEQYQNWLLDRYSKTTANIYCKTIRPVFRWAMRHKWIKDDVFNIPLCKITKKRMRIYETSEFRALLDAAPDDMWRTRLLLARSCGLRRSEILNLTVSDCDFENNLLFIQPKKETRTTWAWEPKSRECRTLPLLEPVANILLRVIAELPADQPYICITALRYYRVMQMKRRGELEDRVRNCPDGNFTVPYKRILKRARVKAGTFHDLRRTYLTEMAESGLPVHWVQALAGHSDAKTTMNYYIAVRQRPMLREARSAAQKIFGVTGIEPATSRPPAERSGQTELHPVEGQSSL